jgi:hypothetical protein
MKKIKFQTLAAMYAIPNPAPASRFIPKWFREMKRVNDGEETVKACMPFLDSLTSGYIIPLSSDVYFEKGKIVQIADIPVVEFHSENQISSEAAGDVYSLVPMKWVNNFMIKTPKGYSCMFMHPANRTDLPFTTLSGIVDTDVYPAPTNFPFLIQSDFTGVILEGTPIAQVFPFKRQDWTHEVEDKKNYKIPAFFQNFVHSAPFDFYKRVFWKKKRFH